MLLEVKEVHFISDPFQFVEIFNCKDFVASYLDLNDDYVEDEGQSSYKQMMIAYFNEQPGIWNVLFDQDNGQAVVSRLSISHYLIHGSEKKIVECFVKEDLLQERYIKLIYEKYKENKSIHKDMDMTVAKRVHEQLSDGKWTIEIIN